MKIEYQGHSGTIGYIVWATGDCFSTSDHGDSYELTHKRLPITVEIPTSIGKDAVSQVNMIAPLIEGGSPEVMIDTLQTLVRRRNVLRGLGYQKFEKFEWYGDGPEIVYEIPVESRSDLERICGDFGFKRTTHAGISNIARGRELVKVAGDRFAILFEATSSYRGCGLKTELVIPDELSSRLGIEGEIHLGTQEIGDYGRKFKDYVIGLLEKADMYVAEARWRGGVTPEAMDYAANTGFMRHALDGELYQEK